MIDRALALAAWAHRSEMRTSRPKPYIEHCVEVAQVLLRYGISDDITLAAALLHDVLEDTAVTADELAAVVPSEVVALVECLSEDAGLDHASRKASHLQRMRGAPPAALAIFAADKLAGAADLEARLRAPDSSEWPPLSGPIEEKLAAMRVAATLAPAASGALRRMLDDLRASVEALEGDRVSWHDLPRLDELAVAARRRMPSRVFDWVDAGAGDGGTVEANTAAWNAVRFRRRAFVDVSEVSTACEILGAPAGAPVLIAPTGRHRMLDEEGEIASAKAAADARTVLCLAMRSTTDLQEVASATTAPLWMQVYVAEDREYTAEVIRAARSSGYRRIVLTIDRQVGATRPRAARHGPPGMRVAGHRTGVDPGVRWDPALTWADLSWVTTQGLPVTVKGVLRGDDARRCIEHGADSVVVSNHGGRQFDRDVPTAVALQEVVEAIGAAVPVLVDGGVRRGAHVLAALALGADAVLIGRPFLWGLAIDGRRGAAHVLRMLQRELREAMAVVGCADIAAVGSDLLARRPR